MAHLYKTLSFTVRERTSLAHVYEFFFCSAAILHVLLHKKQLVSKIKLKEWFEYTSSLLLSTFSSKNLLIFRSLMFSLRHTLWNVTVAILRGIFGLPSFPALHTAIKLSIHFSTHTILPSWSVFLHISTLIARIVCELAVWCINL